MRRFPVTGLLAVAILISVSAFRASAGESHSGPVVGLDVGAGIPISEFQKVAKPGGVVAPFFGYRLGAENIAITPMIQPQFAFFAAKDQDVTFSNDDAPVVGDNRIVRRKTVKSDAQTMASFTGGLRLSLYDETREVYLGGQGGYYTDMGAGAVRGAGAGFNISAGFNYRFLPSTAAGLYIRRDEAYIPANLNSDDNVQFLVAGIGVTHLFMAPEPPPPPPVVAAPVPTPEPEMPEVKKKIVLRGVNFDFDKSNIRDDAKPILDEAVRVLGEAGDVRVSVEGHTDSVGSDTYNMGLSRRRADSVSGYLQSHGIAADRLTTEGFGESRPVATNETSEGRAQNRRVELRVE